MSKFLERFKDKIHKMNREGELTTENKYQIQKETSQRVGYASPVSSRSLRKESDTPKGQYTHTRSTENKLSLPEIIPHSDLSDSSEHTPSVCRHPKSNLNKRGSLDLQLNEFEESKAISLPHSPVFTNPYSHFTVKEKLSKLNSLQVHDYDVHSKNSGVSTIKSPRMPIKSLSNSLLYSSNRPSIDYQYNYKFEEYDNFIRK